MDRLILPCGCHSVTDDGRLWSKQEQFSQHGLRGIQTRISQEWRLVDGTTRTSGYIQVGLHGRVVRLNRLIAINFIPNPSAFPEVQHKNGKRNDNRASNLKWGNQKHNADDRREHGNNCIGEKSPHAKLTDDSVRKIREMRLQGVALVKLAEMFSVSKKLILLVCQRKIWRHVL